MSHPIAPRRRAIAALLSCLTLASAPAFAQQPWKPTKPIRFIVGFSAGGSADALARLLAIPMAERLGVPVVVENIAGAGANIAMANLAHSAPDGYSIGMSSPGPHAINPAIMGSKLPFKVPQDFTPITLLVTQPNVLIVNKDVPANTPAEFAAWMKASKVEVPFGSAGIGTSNHLTGELIGLRLGVKTTHIAYKGASQVIADLMGGHIPMTVDAITTSAPLVREGKVKAIAVTTAQRSPLLPSVPTLSETILPGFDLASWQGLFAPHELPAPILATLYDAATFALNDPRVKAQLAEYGSVPGGMPPSQFSSFLLGELKKWGDIVKAAKVTVD
ncbi:tripartite tricarboxylate transporter substrate binding protein [Xylophilus rhododendri]|uniref:Tripartite tricarboxylate transporter substrate binding protein n=1 Tax=Xylophilus rhododendri TaxID=2697032 RepID=A0A857J4A4_9BURK|nr:tripartite tricarboxylate transporter substrate binding protein [Xylophilus rhododendri]QHI97698.1 tripartite tricarboxylate transporter substrate binding protein [Xylophilus rhododendri]